MIRSNMLKAATATVASVVAIVCIALVAFSAVGHAQSQPQRVKNIVLVHGAFADASSWAKVIPNLERRGFHVVAVQNPLTSLTDDVNATRRIIAMQDGPVILVGHSWGGAVISEAGDDPKVAGLVYVASYVPDVGKSANETSAAAVNGFAELALVANAANTFGFSRKCCFHASTWCGLSG